MASDLTVVSWVYDHLDEFKWYPGQSGSIARHNGVMIHISTSGLTLTDGLKQCRIKMPEPVKLLDAVDYTTQEIREKLVAIHATAFKAILWQVEDPNAARDLAREELFNQLSGII